MKTRAAYAATLTIAALALAITNPTDAHSATGPVVSGTGWKIAAPGITHLDTQLWTIAFHDTTSRTKLTPYLRNVAAELTSYTGLPFTVTTKIAPVTQGKCPPTHTISYRYMSKPDPAHPTRSFTGACSLHNATYSSYVFINSDYWLTTRNYSEATRMNVIWHESGHAVGLTHPATCPRDKTGKTPLMCATGSNGYTDLRTRRYTTWDATGLRRLILNRTYYPQAVVTR